MLRLAVRGLLVVALLLGAYSRAVQLIGGAADGGRTGWAIFYALLVGFSLGVFTLGLIIDAQRWRRERRG